MQLKAAVSTFAAAKRRRRLLLATSVAAVVVLALMIWVASFALAVTPSFPDVPVGHPRYTAITDLASRGIIGGYLNGYFGPDDDVMRQQFAKMIVLAGGYSVSETNVCYFVDVPKGGPTTLYPDNYVAVAAAHGITTGKTATSFDPYSKITRYQVISMVVRAADDLYPGLLAAPPAGWTTGAGWENNPTHGANAARAAYNGLLVGLALSGLDPNANMTRGEVAVVLHNLLNKITASTTTTSASTTTTTMVTTTTSSTTTTSTTTTTVPQGYENLGGAITSGPAAASWGPGRLDVFACSSEGGLMHLAWDGEWQTWEEVGDGLDHASSPAAISRAVNPIDVFARGADDTLLYKCFTGDIWTSWTTLGEKVTSAPAVASIGPGILAVFVRGASGALLVKRGNGILWDEEWTDIGGTMKSGSDPAAVSRTPGILDVFVRGTNDALWHRAFNGLLWTPWENLGGTLSSGPAVISRGTYQMDVFAKGKGNTIWQKSYNAGVWSDWTDLGGGAVASAPAVVAWDPYRMDMFARVAGNILVHRAWNGSAWVPLTYIP